MSKLAPSILSADFSRLAADVASIESGGADLIHVDVMDGHFVPNISFGAAVMKSLEGKTKLPFDVHLMIENPDDYVEDFMTSQTEYITVHEEACLHLHRTLQHIKAVGAKAGVAINPSTSLSTLEYIMGDADMILLMSVNPGFGGQKFIPAVLEKVKTLAEIKKNGEYAFEIEIDGGVTTENVNKVTRTGVDIVVAGSAVFGAEDVTARTGEFLKKMR